MISTTARVCSCNNGYFRDLIVDVGLIRSLLWEVAIMRQLSGVPQRGDGLWRSRTVYNRDAIMPVWRWHPLNWESFGVLGGVFDTWTWYLPDIYLAARLRKLLPGTLGKWCPNSVLDCPDSVTNIKLVCQNCRLAFFKVETLFGEHMRLCRGSSLLLFWVRPVFAGRYVSSVKSARLSALFFFTCASFFYMRLA